MAKTYPDTKAEAEAKYLLFREMDPFPNVQPALLNSADVSNYIKTIGMIWPFDEEQLKGVVLGLTVGDVGIYWDKDKNKISKDIKTDKEFVLKSNSIAYVAIKEELRLPAYIISRFNLRVTNVYRGILLGTGPIVDPGFEGNLFIPLHNLTSNDYVFFPGEPLIEMEFTKLSANATWQKALPEDAKVINDGKYKGWEPTADKVLPKERDMEYYLRRANSGRSIESSLPTLVYNTDKAIDKATRTADKTESSLSRFNVGLLFSFAALLTAIIAIVNIFRGDIKEIKDKKLDEKIRTLEEQHHRDSVLLDSIRKKVFK